MTWEQACIHIETLNREMGGVLASIEWIKLIMTGQLTILVATLGFSWRAKYWAKKNGGGRNGVA